MNYIPNEIVILAEQPDTFELPDGSNRQGCSADIYDPTDKNLKDDPNLTKTILTNVPFDHFTYLDDAYGDNVILFDRYFITANDDYQHPISTMIWRLGMSPGGTVFGNFIIGFFNNGPIVVEVGSELYQELLASTQLKIASVIGSKTLEPGREYKTRAGETRIFIGNVHTAQFKTVSTYNQKTYNRDYTYYPQKVEKLQLWFKGDKAHYKDYKDHEWYYSLIKKSGVVSAGSLVKNVLPIKDIRDMFTKNYKATNRKGNDYEAAYHAKWLNLYEIDDPIILHAHTKKLWEDNKGETL